MTEIDFSIIIPIYNASCYLPKCIESVLNQTYQNIEIICVDDGSCDTSLEILEQYSKRDQHIRVIAKNKNEGTSKARKDGVLCSKGKHILFVDADDILIEYACERLLEVYAKRAADIIQFDAYINVYEGVEKDKANEVQQYLKPCCEEITIEEVRNLCFNIGSLSHSLWGKMFDGGVCRKAFEYLSDDKLIMAEDLYACFIISVFAKSYIGIPDKLYQYNYGIGITGTGKNFLEAFENNCKQLLVVSKCYEFIEKIGEREKYAVLVEQIRRYLINAFISFWITNKQKVEEKEIVTIQKILLENCAKEDLSYIGALMGMYCQNTELVMRNRGWIFPYQSVPRGARIIIYGAGDMGRDYHIQLTKTQYCEIVAWVDKAYDSIKGNGYIIKPPEIIKSLEYDYIIIAIRDIAIREVVKKFLLSMKVQEDAIV